MRSPDWTYDLHIFGTSPKHMPMESLAEVMARFAELLGSSSQVRFHRLRGGSTALLVAVEDGAFEAVNARIVAAGVDPKALPEMQRLNKSLGEHGWRAELRHVDGQVALMFDGARNEARIAGQTVRQHDSLLGTIITIGGRDEAVPMTIQLPSGGYIEVTVKDRHLARKLAKLLFDGEVRVYGTTTWTRDVEGNWTCENMLVESFDVPEPTGLALLFQELRSLPGNNWSGVAGPAAVLQGLTGGGRVATVLIDTHVLTELLYPRNPDRQVHFEWLLWNVVENRGQLLIPAQVLGECLSNADSAGQEILKRLRVNRYVKVVEFEQRAAVEILAMHQAAAQMGDEQWSPGLDVAWQDVKAERRIVAQAKVHKAVVVAEDADIHQQCASAGVQCKRIQDLTTPNWTGQFPVEGEPVLLPASATSSKGRRTSRRRIPLGPGSR